MVKKNKKLNKRETKQNSIKNIEEDTNKKELPKFDIKTFLTIVILIMSSFLLYDNYQKEKEIESLKLLIDNEKIEENIIEDKNTMENSKEVLTNYNGTFGLIYPLIDPTIDILILSILVSIFVSLVNKKFTDQNMLKRNKEESKELNKKLRAMLKTNPAKARELQKELFQKNMENIKQAFNLKVMLITMPVFFLLIPFLKVNYGVFGEIFLGFEWFGTYFIFSIIGSIVFRKLFKVS